MEDHRLCSRKLGTPHRFRSGEHQSGISRKDSPKSDAGQGHKGHPSKGSKGYERGERQSGLRDRD